MANVYDVYVFSGGATAEKVFNAIATFLRGDSYGHLLAIVGMCALLMTMFRFFTSRDHTHLLSYIAVNLTVSSMLLIPTATVRIDDSSMSGRTYFVDNVPIGVAAPIHYATTFMYGLARATDVIFVQPDEAAYTKSGMLFGSKLVGLSQRIGIQDGELKQLWGQYTQNCIRKDITINKKYTWTQFAQAGDIFEFLKNNRPSPVRRIAMNGVFPTCQEALPLLENKFRDEANKSFRLMSTETVINGWATNEALLQNAVVSSYRTFHNINKSASDLLKQNIAVNGVKSGLLDSAASTGATAAAFNYAATHSQMQTQSFMTSMGINAAEWLPIVNSVLILLLACSSIPVFLVAFIPGMTVRVLKGYLGGFFYLALWPFFFTVINLIMTYSLQYAGAESTNLLHGMSLAGSSPLQAMHYKYAAIAGWLMMMVPIISKYALTGGLAMAGSLGQQFLGAMGSNAARSSQAAASGDMTYGVVQTDTWHSNSMSGNKVDTAYSNQSYGAQVQRADGSSVNYLPGGNAVYSSRGAISTTGFDINSSEVQSRALQNSYTEAQRATTQARTAYSQSSGSVTDQLMSLSSSASRNTSYGEGTQYSSNSSTQNSLSKLDGVVAEEAKSKGVSKEEAYKRMFDTYAGLGGGISGSVGLPVGKLSKANGSIDANAGVKYTVSDSSTDSERQDRTSRTSNSRQNQFNDLMSSIEQYGTSGRTEDLHGFNQQAVSTLSEAIKESKDLAKTVDSSIAKEQAYSAALQDSQTGSLSVNTNLMPEFQAYVARRRPENVEAIMNGNTPAINEERDLFFQAFMSERFSNYNPELKQSWDDSSMNRPAQSVQGSDIQGNYERNSGSIENQYQTEQGHRQKQFDEESEQSQRALYDNDAYLHNKQEQENAHQLTEQELKEVKKYRGMK
ncbi:conjugal transfer protein TraG [Photobacterium damselae subsp. damselae]|uniref:conjugal transfer mating-pair stabilization protein TraG n=1 Tax=Photobacterium damselae TaxID=38293 RepID=UPI000D06CBE4|nr:conjugal transfer mating-pair stabilization protein TraG [Photobacterium damselae]PSB79798.1 conjugal transfer protein TraG [Photobacterium damselae subsp. damselae]